MEIKHRNAYPQSCPWATVAQADIRFPRFGAQIWVTNIRKRGRLEQPAVFEGPKVIRRLRNFPARQRQKGGSHAAVTIFYVRRGARGNCLCRTVPAITLTNDSLLGSENTIGVCRGCPEDCRRRHRTLFDGIDLCLMAGATGLLRYPQVTWI